MLLVLKECLDFDRYPSQYSGTCQRWLKVLPNSVAAKFATGLGDWVCYTERKRNNKMERLIEILRRLLLAVVALVGGFGTYFNYIDGEYTTEFAAGTIASILVINWIFYSKKDEIRWDQHWEIKTGQSLWVILIVFIYRIAAKKVY